MGTTVSIKVEDQAELDRWTAESKTAGVPLGDWIRARCNAVPLKVKTPTVEVKPKAKPKPKRKK